MKNNIQDNLQICVLFSSLSARVNKLCDNNN